MAALRCRRTRPRSARVLVLFLIMSINVYLATQTVGVFKISHLGVSPTEGRIALIVLNTVLIFVKQVPIGSWRVWLLDIVAARQEFLGRKC